jgi:phosphoribosylanthranilate isomerase
MRVKVCGMTRMDQVRRLEELGVEFAGLIFYPRSPRFVGKSSLEPEVLRRERLNINKVGVFVNATLDEVLRTVDLWRLQMVQLHGDESVKFCEQVSNHVTTVKAFRVSGAEDLSWRIYPYREVSDMFLFDSAGAAYGGNGVPFDWESLAKTDVDKPFFLSGGIGPEDAQRVSAFADRQPDLFAVDVNSRFETSPGVKDMQKVEDFCRSLGIRGA